MEEKGQQGKDRVSPASIPALPLHGDGIVPDNNYMDKPLSPKDERIVSPDDGGSMRNISTQSEPLNPSGAPTPTPIINPSNIFAPPDQTYFYGGYDDGSANWGDYSNYASNLQIVPPQAIYNDNASVLFHPGYGFDYSQFSPVASPMSPVMIDGQLFSPHQLSNYYSQPVSPDVPAPPPQAAANSGGQEGGGGGGLLSPGGSGYYVQYGNHPGNNGFGFYKYPGDIEQLPNRSMSSDTATYVTSGALYPAPLGILGSYEHIFAQIPQQQTAYGYGYGSVSGSGSSTRHYPQSGGYNYNYNYGNNNFIYQGEASRLNRFIPEKGGKQRDRDGIISSMINNNNNNNNNNNEPHGRGPRASKPKGDQQQQIMSSPPPEDKEEGKNDIYNRPDFVTSYENAKFFVIKSFSEDNVHKSIKYGVWASTPLGNRKLDAAYQQAKESSDASCPVFLFFSVNASGQFCGVAEMDGPVDFVNDAEYWQQDRWSGQFRVKWHIIKDVPNSRFRHILLENNDNKPVTHSRDSQEVKLEVGNAMLKIFKDHDADTSILDDFSYYDEREKDLQEKRSKEREFTKNTPTDTSSIGQLADKVAESLHVDDKREIQ